MKTKSSNAVNQLENLTFYVFTFLILFSFIFYSENKDVKVIIFSTLYLSLNDDRDLYIF